MAYNYRMYWDASTDTGGSGLKEYIIYKDDIEYARTTSTSYWLGNTMPSGCFHVTAIDNDGNESGHLTCISKVYGLIINISSVSETSNINACAAGNLNNTVLSTGNELSVEVGNVLYSDDGITRFDGGLNWWKVQAPFGVEQSVLVAPDGTVADEINCP